VVVALFADVIASAASGFGQEIVNASILLLAVCMLAWHNIWMSQHGRELAARMRSVGNAVRGGSRPLYALAVVVGIAVLREGSEVVLFLYGIAASGPGQLPAMAGGGALGFVAAAALGVLMYFGLLRISARHLFGVMGWLVLLLAAGMASQAAAFLVQGEILPALGESVWDTSWLLADGNLVAKILHTLVGYTAQPYGIQVLFYVVTLCVILALTRLAARAAQRSARGASAAGRQHATLSS
jgi:high-affinity iron transporter